jgi:pimeloyl-ACP methyl ester carboxylesterase
VALLHTRSWEPAAPGSRGPQDPGAKGTQDPGPKGAQAPGAKGVQDPGTRLPGPPIREGSPTGPEGGRAVHSPPVTPPASPPTTPPTAPLTKPAATPLALLIHGVTSSSRTWWRVGPVLAGRGFRVVAVDLRGHGGSPPTVAGLSVADLAGDVAETVEGPVDLLVGHSLGALVALEVVAARPGFARRLVVEDPPGPGSIDWAAVAAEIEADTNLAVTDPDGLRRDLEAANPSWVPGEAERRIADLADCDGPAIAAALRQGVPFDLPAMLAAADPPVLMLLATEALGSILTGLDRKAAVEAVGDGATRVLPAGHSVHREALDAWLAALDAWLAAS